MAGPISVEDMLAKQKAEKDAAAKPKFLSKADRAKLALEKRNAEVKAQQDKEEAEKRERIAFEQAAEEERRRQEAARYGAGQQDNRYGRYGRDDRYQQGGRYNGRDDRQPSGSSRGGPPTGPRGAPSGPRSMQNGNGHASSPLAGSSNGAAPSSPKPTTPGDAAGPTDAELNSIRARYLGQKVVEKKPRLRKEADKKNLFDWKETEDTSVGEPSWAVELQGVRATNGHVNGKDADAKFADPLEKRRAGKGNTDERNWRDKPLEDMKDRDWRIFREDFGISARGGAIPHPLRSWRESAIPSEILDIVDEVGYKEPSPIQRASIPIGLQYRDLIGIAQTGSGKTAAFVIPMLSYIRHLPPLDDRNRFNGPYALILAPTRELAQQIATETVKFTSKLGLTAVAIVGGKDVEAQAYELRNGAEVIIATPGRLRDMLQQSRIVLSQCRYLVLDEADRMLHLGFESELNDILDTMPAAYQKTDDDLAEKGSTDFTGQRITSLFSATFPIEVQRLTGKYLKKPATIQVGGLGEGVDSVRQEVEFISGEQKKASRLISILREGGYGLPAIVFVGQKKTTETVVKYVYQAGLSATTLHSDKTQEQREAALQSLRDGEVSVLVATDVAARGIDIDSLQLVVNWQMPSSIDYYIHRIGRTGRAGKTGTAISFVSENDDAEILYDLKAEIARSPVSTMNPQLSRSEHARQRITGAMKRKLEELGD